MAGWTFAPATRTGARINRWAKRTSAIRCGWCIHNRVEGATVAFRGPDFIPGSGAPCLVWIVAWWGGHCRDNTVAGCTVEGEPGRCYGDGIWIYGSGDTCWENSVRRCSVEDVVWPMGVHSGVDGADIQGNLFGARVVPPGEPVGLPELYMGAYVSGVRIAGNDFRASGAPGKTSGAFGVNVFLGPTSSNCLVSATNLFPPGGPEEYVLDLGEGNVVETLSQPAAGAASRGGRADCEGARAMAERAMLRLSHGRAAHGR